MTLVNSLIGLSEEQAMEKLAQAGFKGRLISIDGKPLVVTADIRADRAELSVSNSVVTAARVG